MKKILSLIALLLLTFSLVACTNDNEPNGNGDEEIVDSFLLLMQAEDLSGMKERTRSVIRVDGSLNLPTTYHGVQISYQSRNEDIISNDGVVTRPDTCWIESRDQQGIADEKFNNLNDNWPIVVDVTLTYEGQVRTAKLLFVVAPREGFTCDKYLGN